MFGNRISLLVGFLSVLLAMLIGVTLGTMSGYIGGWLDSLIMRLADAQLTVPPILIALLVNGVARASLMRELQESLAIYVLVFSIGIAAWPQYARVTRSGAMVERNKEYIAAAKVIGVHPVMIMVRHIVPNVMGPTLVLATIGVPLAIIIEATLSFLGVGVPPTTPSLGTLIRIGNEFLFSGEWWITIFPALALVVLVLSVNLIGDWLRDTFNPKLR
jgi:peptide/nickel transport system permease protein